MCNFNKYLPNNLCTSSNLWIYLKTLIYISLTYDNGLVFWQKCKGLMKRKAKWRKLLRNMPLDKTLDCYSTKAKDKRSTFNIMQTRKYAMRKYNSLLLFNFKYIFNQICKIRFYCFFFLETKHTYKKEWKMFEYKDTP